MRSFRNPTTSATFSGVIPPTSMYLPPLLVVMPRRRIDVTDFVVSGKVSGVSLGALVDQHRLPLPIRQGLRYPQVAASARHYDNLIDSQHHTVRHNTPSRLVLGDNHLPTSTR